jgi:hypothetical protein
MGKDRIDTNYICPELGQRSGTNWARNNIGKVENPDTLKDSNPTRGT